MKNQLSPFVEIKQVTWAKDSHGLFDYESRSIEFIKTKVESAATIYKDGANITIHDSKKGQPLASDKDPNYLLSIMADPEKKGMFSVQSNKVPNVEDNDKLYLIVRSLKNDDGTQRGYNLELGDVIRLGRIEYRVIEFQNHTHQTTSLFTSSDYASAPFTISIKDCNGPSENKKQCRICLMDEQDTPEELVNPCNCKGTSEYVHIQCLQDWISSKLKKKVNPDAACYYWKKLICEVCKVSLPDLVEINGSKKELIPISRPEGPYILLERVFYDKTKESAENAKMMILLHISNESQQIKFGRGHECDLRESDISVSRLHAFIKYHDGHFTIFDNNSKFGTLVLLRKNIAIEKKKKVALQLGRTVITFSLKYAAANNIPVFRNPIFMEKLTKWQAPKDVPLVQPKSSPLVYSKSRAMTISPNDEGDAEPTGPVQSRTFLD